MALRERQGEGGVAGRGGAAAETPGPLEQALLLLLTGLLLILTYLHKTELKHRYLTDMHKYIRIYILALWLL